MQAFVKYIEATRLENFSHEEVVKWCRKFLNYIKDFQNKIPEKIFFKTSGKMWCKYNYRDFIEEKKALRLYKGITLKELKKYERS